MGHQVFATFITFVALTLTLAVFTTWIRGDIDDLSDQLAGATIAGTTVPAVHCQEDEVISWTGPDALGCVHYEDVK